MIEKCCLALPDRVLRALEMETVVRVTGAVKGGRNQEMPFVAAKGVARLPDTVVPAVGSDGTDGPMDAAGGIVDGDGARRLMEAGVDLEKALADNDSCHALAACVGLVVTGPTGINVNDLVVLLCR